MPGALACISHQLSTAAADKAVSTALRSAAVLNVLFKYACARRSVDAGLGVDKALEVKRIFRRHAG
jgi:hypothetical protein